jgi:tetratricopeptide (TPR) repeat protein
VLELEPANVDAHFELGCVALITHRYEQANLEFELVLKLDAQYPGIRQAMGEALLRRDRRDEGRRYLVEEFEHIRSASPDGSPFPSADELARLEPPDRAGLESVLVAGRSRVTRLAELLMEAGEPARAASLLESALALEERPDLLRKLALARFQSGDLSGGSAASRRVLRLEPDCIRSIHNLALAALEQSQVRIAAGWVRRGLKLNRHDDGLRRLRMRVASAFLTQRMSRAIQRGSAMVAFWVAAFERTIGKRHKAEEPRP